ncbi:MAG TPA: extracellular solute-binding protein [Anaerolineae bacterium]|nr:extracellular solute-binding protein [Anaerolineae bacterium]
MIDRNSPIPIYYQLTCYFKELIEMGELRPGDRLPTEMELCERHRVSRAPVRRALTDLAREGYIYRRAGQGTFVAPVNTSQEGQLELRLVTHHDIRWLATLEQAVYLWNQLHAEQRVRISSTISSRSDFHHVLRRLVAQGKAPDIAPMDYVWICDYALGGYLTPADALDARWTRRLCEGLESLVYQGNEADGRLYGLPVQTDVTGLWYRKDWFEQEGLTPPQTWPEWLALLDYFARPEVMQRLGHRYVTAFPVSELGGEATVNLLIPFVWGAEASGAITSGEGALATLLPGLQEALRFLREITLTRRQLLPPNMADTPWWDFPPLLSQGVVPMILGGTYEWPRIQEDSDWEDEEEVSRHLGFVPVPRPTLETPPTCSLGGTSWAILEQSPNHELSFEILKLAASAELSAEFCMENLQLSPYRAVNENLISPQHPWLTLIVPLLHYARLRPQLVNYMQLSRVLQDTVYRALWQGAVVEETLRHTTRLLQILVGDVG